MTRARETSENARQAKAWVNFDGSATIRGSHNVSSVTDLTDAGHFDVNFEESFPNANYSWAGGAGDSNVTTVITTPNSVRTGQMTTDKIRISVNYAYTNSIASHDYQVNTLIVFGD